MAHTLLFGREVVKERSLQPLHQIRTAAQQHCRELFIRQHPEPVMVATHEVEGDLHWVEPETPLPAPPRSGDTLGLVAPGGRRRYVIRRSIEQRFARLGTPAAGRSSFLMLGRSRGCDVLVRDFSVSDLHLKLYPVAGTSVVFVEDMGSRNGTWVDGWELPEGQRRELASGAELQVGRLVFLFLNPWDVYDHLCW